jgi:hypothetical protein
VTRKPIVCASVAALLSAGCVKVPTVLIVDRATALEQQASGSYDELEARLNRAAVEPRLAPLTPEQLEALGVRPLAPIAGTPPTDAEEVDALLIRHCVGEATDGLLVVTPGACRGALDEDRTARSVERVNRARRQLWLWMHTQRADVPLDELRHGWRQLHAEGIVCGGWLQGDDGQWQPKAC